VRPISAAIALAVAAPAGACRHNDVETRPIAAARACAKGERDCLPDVDYVDTTGAAYPRDSLSGKVVLVNFWATWCAPCEKEIPDLSRAYQKYKARGVVFFGVLIDNPDHRQLLNFQSALDMSYPVVRANRELLASFDDPEAYPTTYIYDRSGKQVYNHVGQVRESELDRLLAALVAPVTR
jgi:thiol-disulfide isomerase/thioredoxin